MIRSLGLSARTVSDPEQADLLIALRARADDLRLKRLTGGSGIPLHFIKRNTANEMRRLLERLFHVIEGVEGDEVAELVRETEAAIQRALAENAEVPLAPRRPALRKLQHRIIAGHGLVAQSRGREPERHLVIYPSEAE